MDWAAEPMTWSSWLEKQSKKFQFWNSDFMSQCKNVFEAILRYGHDEDFVPRENEQFIPTDAPAGSSDKIEVLRRRVELGQPLWHTTDRVDYSGLTGAIRPRE